MANPIVQRLIAAGASPARANAFAAQFAKSQPSVKTADLEDAFDDQLAELSKVWFPNAFRPPAVDDPRINDYVDFVYGPGTFQKIETQVFAKNAPAFNKALQSGVVIEKNFADAIKAGQSLGSLEAILQTPAGQAALVTKDADGTVTGAYPLEDAKALAKTLFDDYNSASTKIAEEKAKFLNADKTYAAGLPSNKLKYGRTEDLKNGIVSWKTSNKVEKVLAKEAGKIQSTLKTQYGDEGPKSSAAAGIASPDSPELEQKFFKQFMTQKKVPTPLKDEISRREYLKDKTGN